MRRPDDGAHAGEGVEEAEVSEDPEAHRREDEVRAGLDHDALPALEEDEVDARAEEGVRGRQAYGAAAYDDDFEVGCCHGMSSVVCRADYASIPILQKTRAFKM